MSTCSAVSRSCESPRLMRAIAAYVVMCLLTLLTLAGCAGTQQGECGSGQQATPLEETPFVQARYGFPGVSNAIVLDGTIELVTVEMEAPTTEAADATAEAETPAKTDEGEADCGA